MVHTAPPTTAGGDKDFLGRIAVLSDELVPIGFCSARLSIAVRAGIALISAFYVAAGTRSKPSALRPRGAFIQTNLYL